MRWVFALVIATGCYAPSPSPGAPCAEGGVCPAGLECKVGICVTPGTTPSDGPQPDGPSDGPPTDSPSIDAPVSASGCSDGEREGFPDVGEFPTIAGCGATWTDPKDMRANKTGQACGDDLGACDAPADACGDGWSICGLDGLPSQISDRVDAKACLSAGGVDTGAYASAMSHCTSFEPMCVYDLPLPCAEGGAGCAESICCGPGCSSDIGCADAAYEGTTRVAGNFEVGCAALDASFATGVLCCKD